MSTTADPGELLAVHDAVLREGGPPPPGWRAEWDGPVLRHYSDSDACVVYSRLTLENADAAVAGQRDWARRHGLNLEWKHYGHDRPADLPARLAAAGYVAEPPETLLIASVADLADRLASTGPPSGIRLREVGSQVSAADPAGDPAGDPATGLAADLARLHELRNAVWGGRLFDLSGELATEKAADPASLRIVFAEDAADGLLVCAAWLRLHPHTATGIGSASGPDFGSLWGGGTRPGWRGRGIYKATVAYRVARAVEARCRWLVVDASVDSRPILRRLGFVPLTTTTPYVLQG